METDWQLECKNLNQRIDYMFKSGQWTDCTFLVGLKPDQEKIGCHKNILASASPVFAAMFYGEMAERQSPIPIPDIQPETFKAMLKYIYTEQDFTICSFDVGSNLYYAANKYNLPFIKEKCVNYINTFLDTHFNFIFQIYEFALLYEETMLKNKCLQIMRTQTRRILEHKGLIEAQVSTVVAIFSLEKISCAEETVYYALVRYLKTQEVIMESMAKSTGYPKKCIENSADCNDNSGPLEDVTAVKVQSGAESGEESGAESGPHSHSQGGGGPTESERKSIARILLGKIRFLTFTAKQFALGPAQSGLLTESEAYAILMKIVTNESPVPMPSGFSTSKINRSYPTR